MGSAHDKVDGMPNNSSNLVLLSGQLALSRAMDVVANNIANASTTGYKREGISFDSLLGKSSPNSNKMVSFVYDRTTYRDTTNGPIVKTSNPLDLAIQGQGYFQVQKPDGSTAYTRDGSFQLNTEGQIVTNSGNLLIGDGGPISIPETASQINISQDGFVTARVDNGAALAQIGKIVLNKFDNEQAMQPMGEGLYTTTQTPTPATDSAIKQGSIEQSNVEPVTEITDMIRIMRSYEQVSNMISNENQRQTDSVSRLSKTSS
jgi:flagellar basal-body rod protein FlgF